MSTEQNPNREIVLQGLRALIAEGNMRVMYTENLSCECYALEISPKLKAMLEPNDDPFENRTKAHD